MRMLFTIFDKMWLDRFPLEGYRTYITGYLLAAVPLVMEVLQSGTEGTEFWYKLGFALFGGALNAYFRSKAGDKDA